LASKTVNIVTPKDLDEIAGSEAHREGRVPHPCDFQGAGFDFARLGTTRRLAHPQVADGAEIGAVANSAKLVLMLGVPLDKNEGVVKRHVFTAMLSSTAWISEWWRTEALKLSR
jgi:hypothetical protein